MTIMPCKNSLAWRRQTQLVLVAISLILSSCGLPPTTIPISTTTVTANKNSDTLLIFLPGIHDTKDDFIKRGFFSRIASLNHPVDMLAADLHVGYLENGSSVTRIYEDLIKPARKRGYKKIWLVGISLGGLHALLYQKSRPDDLCGIILLSPYLGDKQVQSEIMKAGGIKTWKPESNRPLTDSESLWAWLLSANPEDLYLGTGSSDRFIILQQQLALLLPEANTHIIEGAHRWTTWDNLWQFYTTQFERTNMLNNC